MHLYVAFFFFLFTGTLVAQNDSVSPVRAWIYSHGGETEEFAIDTGLSPDFSSYPGYYQQSLAWHGNTWSPVYPLVYSPRFHSDVSVSQWLGDYPSFQNTVFYHTRRPFSLIYFNTNAKKPMPEQNLTFLHTQNINPWWNVGVTGNFATSKGAYQHQENRMNNLRLFSTYNSPKHNGHVSYNFGKAGIQENGGITDAALYSDSLLPPENIPVALTDAVNTIKYRSLDIKQEHVIARGKTDSVTTVYPWTLSGGGGFLFHRFRRIYTDIPSNYYTTIFTDSAATLDSSQLSVYKSSAFIKLDLSHTMGIYASAFFERNDYGVLENHLRHDETGAGGGVYLHYPKLEAEADVHFHSSKDEEGLIHIHGHGLYTVSEEYLQIFADGAYIENHPAFQDVFYVSNHFAWNNDFVNLRRTRFEAGVEIPRYHARFSAVNHTIAHAIYYDTLARPVQDSNTVQHFCLSLDFRMQSKHWTWRPRLQYQQLSDENLPGVPAWIASQHIAYGHRIFKVLEFQVGADMFYTTSFFGPSYMPATMVWYTQTDVKTGGYPVADVFVSFKLKRARFLFKVHHVNDRLMERNHFLVNGYPLPDRHYSLGISWGFYN